MYFCLIFLFGRCNEITIGHGKTRKTNKNIKRIKKHAQQ